MAGETFTVPGRGRRLDVHFGLGQELFVCGLDSGDHAVCSSLIWSAPGPAARQAAFDALPHVQRLSSNDISGQAGSGSVQKTAASISASLHSACSLEDDMAAQGADTLLSTESAVWDLIVLLFVDQGKDGYIAESLSKWTKQHAAILGAGLEADCTQYEPPHLSSLLSHQQGLHLLIYLLIDIIYLLLDKYDDYLPPSDHPDPCRVDQACSASSATVPALIC